MSGAPPPAKSIDLNADVGEGYADAELLPLVTSANVACGAHAGDAASMRATLELAHALGVRSGAHPGFPDRSGFGRRITTRDPAAIAALVGEQITALLRIAAQLDAAVAHVKPHGALYMEAARDETLSRLMVEALLKSSPETLLFCMGVSKTCSIARDAGLPVVREFYADRDYDRSGSIVFARRMRPLDPMEVADKCVRACLDGKVRTVEGDDIDIAFESICFHSDTPGALAIGTTVRDQLLKSGLRIATAAEVVANAA